MQKSQPKPYRLLQVSAYEKMIRRRAARLTADQFVDLAEWVYAHRRSKGLTQRVFARHFQIPERQVKTYEAVAKWPLDAKSVIRERPAAFLVTDLTRQFAARAWPSGELLKEALQRHAARCPAVALPAGTRDPNITFLEEDLGAALTAPVKIIGNGMSGQLRITFTSPEDLERILSRLSRDLRIEALESRSEQGFQPR